MLPENTYINICKLAQEIYKNHYSLDQLNRLEVGSKKRPMCCTYMLDVPEEFRMEGFSYYDSAVCDAVYTLYKYQYENITLNDIIRVMAYDEKIRFFYQKAQPQKREARLRRSLEKLRTTGIVIDFRDEVEKRALTDSEGQPLLGLLADHILPLEPDSDGKTFWFAEGKKLPVYAYAETIGQIICVPEKLIAPEKYPFSNTDEVILLRRILIQRIEAMANEKNRMGGRKIRYYGNGTEEGIFPLIGVKKENFSQEPVHKKGSDRVRYESRGWKNKVHDLDKKVGIILDTYKKYGYIEDYESLKNTPRELVRGVEIKGEIHRMKK